MTIYANNVAGVLGATIGPSDTALLLQTGQGALFPAPGADSYYATIVHQATGAIEIVQVTGKSADTLTIVRGRDNTSGISMPVGSVIEMRLVAQMLRELDWRNYVNVPLGICQLDVGGLVPDARIPAGITRDSELTAGLATKQNSLGFTPVQQGTGVGQVSNTVKIGWKAGSKLGLTVDASDLGNFAMEAWVTALGGVPSGFATLDGGGKIPSGQLPALNYLPLSGGNLSGSLNILSGGSLNVAANMFANNVISQQNFESNSSAAVLSTNGAGIVYLRPNGSGSATGQATLSNAGLLSAPDIQSTSDARLKSQITPQKVRTHLADQLMFKRWVLDETGKVGVGVVAQDLEVLAPEYVGDAGNGYMSVDYSKLALEAVIGLAARVRDLERASPNR